MSVNHPCVEAIWLLVIVIIIFDDHQEGHSACDNGILVVVMGLGFFSRKISCGQKIGLTRSR